MVSYLSNEETLTPDRGWPGEGAQGHLLTAAPLNAMSCLSVRSLSMAHIEATCPRKKHSKEAWQLELPQMAMSKHGVTGSKYLKLRF